MQFLESKIFEAECFKRSDKAFPESHLCNFSSSISDTLVELLEVFVNSERTMVKRMKGLRTNEGTNENVTLAGLFYQRVLPARLHATFSFRANDA
jgi:hypothetical protein